MLAWGLSLQLSLWPCILTTCRLSDSIFCLSPSQAIAINRAVRKWIKDVKMFAIFISIFTSISFQQKKSHLVVLKVCRILLNSVINKQIFKYFCSRWSFSYVYTSSNPLGGKHYQNGLWQMLVYHCFRWYNMMSYLP